MSNTFSKLSALVALAVCLAAARNLHDLRAQVGNAPSAWHAVPDWPQIPPGKVFTSITGVAVDKGGNVYAFQRDTGEISKFDKSGRYLGNWGPGVPGFARGAHSIYIDKSGNVWTVERDRHVVRKWTADGKLLLTVGKDSTFGDTLDTFNGPSSLHVMDDGGFVVGDGYWNSRVLFFDKNGKHLKQIGGPFSRRIGVPITATVGQPATFGYVHAVGLDRKGRLFVVDRCSGASVSEFHVPRQVSRSRNNPGCRDNYIQVVDKRGRHVAFWTDPVNKYTDGGVGAVTLQVVGEEVYATDMSGVVILDAATGKVLDTIAEAKSAHQLAVDEQGNVYTAALQPPKGMSPLRKFTKSP